MRNGGPKFGFLCLRYIKIEETNFTIGYATMRNGERNFFTIGYAAMRNGEKKKRKREPKFGFQCLR